MRVLAVSAHPDDAEWGCGGSLARHSARGDQVTMAVLSAGAYGVGAGDRRTEQENSCAILGADLVWGGFEDCSISKDEHGLVQFLERVIQDVRPDIVYTHGRDDTHQDHRAVAIASLGATRKLSRILAYESPSSLNFLPNSFIDISDSVDKKLDALSCHASQVEGSTTIDVEAIRGQAAFRGFQARVAAAEAFMTVRFLLDY